MKQIYETFNGYKLKLIIGSLLKTVEAFFELLIPLYIAKIINEGVFNNDLKLLYSTIIIMVIFFFLGYICSIISQYLSSVVSSSVGMNIRNKIFSKIINFSQKEMDDFNSEFINNAITNDVKQIETGINMIMRIGLRAPIVAIGSIIMAITINYKLSLIFIFSTIIVFGLLYYFLYYLSKLYLILQKHKDKLNHIISEQVDGSRVIRTYNKQKTEINRAKFINDLILKQEKTIESIQSLLNPITYLIINIALILILYISNNYINNKIIIDGDVVALINYLTQTFTAISALVNLIFIFSKFIASLDRIKSLFDYKVIIDNKRENNIDTIKTLEFKNVSFSYKNKKQVLENISFKVESNTTLGIIGLTGSGKSTLAKLLLNLYKCSNGNILLNNININSISKENLKKNISMVMQKPNLFSGTIKENFYIANKFITKEEIDRCLKLSEAYDFVYSFKDKLDTILLENAKNLSGGQKQRLSIAIALAKNPQLLVLDDSSSALDLKTEKKLYCNLKNSNISNIKIIISQRTSIMNLCDKILVIDSGNIVGCDTYESLLKNNATFKRIVLSQEESELE